MQSTQTKSKMADEQKTKLSEEEKNTLIGFYEIKRPLWSYDCKFKDKEEKGATRDEMGKLFDQTYSANFLEKLFILSEQRLYENIRKSLLGKTQIRRNGNFTKNLDFSKKK